MKKFRLLFSLLLIVFFCGNATVQAQISKGNHLLNLGIGTVSAQAMRDGLDDMVIMIIPFGYKAEIERCYGPVLHLNYRYAVSDRFLLGATYAFENMKADIIYEEVVVEKENRFSHTFAWDVSWIYAQKNKLSLYTTLGFGGTFNRTTSNATEGPGPDVYTENHFNAHFSPLGIRYGNKAAAFAEFGFGYKGLIMAGFDYRF